MNGLWVTYKGDDIEEPTCSLCDRPMTILIEVVPDEIKLGELMEDVGDKRAFYISGVGIPRRARIDHECYFVTESVRTDNL